MNITLIDQPRSSIESFLEELFIFQNEEWKELLKMAEQCVRVPYISIKLVNPNGQIIPYRLHLEVYNVTVEVQNYGEGLNFILIFECI